MSLFLYGNSPEMTETEGKFSGKDYGNYAEMRKIEGKFCGKKHRHEHEFIYVRKLCGNEGN